MNDYRNKVIVVVNVASKMWIIPLSIQGLQELVGQLQKKRISMLLVCQQISLVGQEPGSNNSEIKDFCETNFSINFPMTKQN